MFRAPIRSLSGTARTSLKIGLIPADGVGREVIPVCLSHVRSKLSMLSYSHRQQKQQSRL